MLRWLPIGIAAQNGFTCFEVGDVKVVDLASLVAVWRRDARAVRRRRPERVGDEAVVDVVAVAGQASEHLINALVARDHVALEEKPRIVQNLIKSSFLLVY